MISDVMSEAIHDVEEYQRIYPDSYADFTRHIEFTKRIMASLMNVLDEPPGGFPPFEGVLTEEQRQWWQVTCEANIQRWIERLELLGAVSVVDLLGKLKDAVERQKAMLAAPRQQEGNYSGLQQQLFTVVIEDWNESATQVAADALRYLVNDCPELLEELVAPIAKNSDYWLEQIARAVLHLPSDDTEDFAALLQQITDKQNSVQKGEAGEQA